MYMTLDFDAAVVGIASQPFWLRWADEARQAGVACAGLLRPPQGWLGGGDRLPTGGAPHGSGHGKVRRDGAGLRAGRLPATVFRAKDIIYSSDVPTRRAVLQVVGKRVEISVHDEWGSRTPRTQIVVIARPAASMKCYFTASSRKHSCGTRHTSRTVVLFGRTGRLSRRHGLGPAGW